MAWTVFYVRLVRLIEVEDVQKYVGNGLNIGLHAAADVVGLSNLPASQDEVDSPTVVVNVQPLSFVAAAPVEGHLLVLEEPNREMRDQLLRELVGTVVVGAVGDGNGQMERLKVGTHGQISRRFGGVVGCPRPIGRRFDKDFVRIERQIAIHFAGGDVVESRQTGIPCRLKERLRAQDVRPIEDVWMENGTTVVRLGGKVHHIIRLIVIEEMVYELVVPNVTFDKHVVALMLLYYIRQAAQIAGIREQIIVDDEVIRVLR